MRAIAIILLSGAAWGEQVAVRLAEGSLRGFVVLRTVEGELIANGELLQVTQGRQISSELVYHFKDGSLQDETVTFTQNGKFRLSSYHIVKKGPTFQRPTDMTINPSTGMVTVRYKNDKGEEKVEAETLKLTPDLANGLIQVLLKNLAPGTISTTVSMVVATPKPLLVKLVITPDGEETFTTGSASHKATRYTVKVDIPGIRGVLAPIVGKQPPDAHVWILPGKCPSYLKSEEPYFEGGPLWVTEPVSPAWPKPAPSSAAARK